MKSISFNVTIDEIEEKLKEFGLDTELINCQKLLEIEKHKQYLTK
jgi:hypothetical protein